MRHRFWHWAGLAVYLAAVVVCPGLHLVHHADALAAAGAAHEAGEHGVAADLVALGLEDVGAASPVDCELASFTLADCARPAHGVRRFGDAAAQPADAAGGSSSHGHKSGIDPRHGAGALEHLGVSLLAARVFVLPPPRCSETRIAVVPRPVAVSLVFRRCHESRGPPAAV